MISGIAWNAVAATDALLALDNNNPQSYQQIAALMSQSGTVVVDGTGLTTGFENFPFLFYAGELMTQPFQFTGTDFSDDMSGTQGSDQFVMGANDSSDFIWGSGGSDTYDFSSATGDSFYQVIYEDQGPLSINFDLQANTGSVAKLTTGGTDTFVGLDAVFAAVGLFVTGSEFNDTVNIVHVAGPHLNVAPLEGNDVINITFTGGDLQTYLNGVGGSHVRLSYIAGGDVDATSGLVMNLAMGVVANDGLGFTDQINIAGSGVVEIRATDRNDSIIGSRRDEIFILEQGSDTVNGAGGDDLVRYSRPGTDLIVADLAQNTITGRWDGVAFVHTVHNIEAVAGSREGSDQLSGDRGSNYFNGLGGNDTINGRAGDGFLYGGEGNDTIIGGGGKDEVFGFKGDDIARLGGGNDFYFESRSAAGKGKDSVFGGGGNDTLRGGNGADSLSGQNGDDDLQGGAGNDLLTGGKGDDRLAGGGGRDTLDGGTGNDTLTGGGSKDTFVFSGRSIGQDVITDFKARTDSVQLDSALWSGNLSKAQILSTFGETVDGSFVLDFGSGNVITFEGLEALRARDFDII